MSASVARLTLDTLDEKIAEEFKLQVETCGVGGEPLHLLNSPGPFPTVGRGCTTTDRCHEGVSLAEHSQASVKRCRPEN